MSKQVLVLETLEDTLHTQVVQLEGPICRGGEDFVSIYSRKYYGGDGILVKIPEFFALG